MDFISKQKFKTWIIILLLSLNIGSMLQLWMIRRPHDGPPPPFHEKDRLFISDLKMSKEQTTKFEKQRDTFFNSSNKIVTLIEHKKNEILIELYKETPNIEKLDSLSNEIGNLQKGVEKLLYKDILKMKEIMTKEQFIKFKNIINFSHKPPMREHKGPPRFREYYPPHHENHPR